MKISKTLTYNIAVGIDSRNLKVLCYLGFDAWR